MRWCGGGGREPGRPPPDTGAQGVGTVQDALGYSTSMMEITTGTNPNLTIPILDFRGVATGIDLRKVEETGILPVINTAIAHKEPGIGMIGAGITHPPIEAFHQATLALAATF